MTSIVPDVGAAGPGWATEIVAFLRALELGGKNPLNHGAVGDGIADDTAALIEAASQACADNVPLLLPTGKVFLVSGGGTIIPLTRGIEITGGGTIKIADSNGGWTTIFGPAASEDMTGLWVHHLTFDGNRTGNPLTAGEITSFGITTGPRAVVMFDGSGYGVRVDDNRFTNFDSTWLFAVTGGTFLSFCRNKVDHFGNATPALEHDASLCYLDGFGATVADNDIWAGAPGDTTYVANYGARSALEVHGGMQHVHHNKVRGFQAFAQMTPSTVGTTAGFHWHDNHGEGIGYGIVISTYGDEPITDVNIHNNVFLIDYLLWFFTLAGTTGCSGILFNTLSTAAIERWKINDNVIKYKAQNVSGQSMVDGTPFFQTSWGIGLWAQDGGHVQGAHDVEICRNTIVGAPDNAIYLTFANADGVKVNDNLIRDAVATASGIYPYDVPIFVTAYGFLANYEVNRNKVIDEQSSTNHPYGNTATTMGHSRAIAVDAHGTGSGQGELLDNTYSWVGSPSDVKLAEGCSEATGKAPYLRCHISGVPGTFLFGNWSPGSMATVLGTGAVYVQTATPGGATWTAITVP